VGFLLQQVLPCKNNFQTLNLLGLFDVTWIFEFYFVPLVQQMPNQIQKLKDVELLFE
jgi:hypothetical protein